MDKLKIYREFIQEILTRYAKHDVGDDSVDVQLIFDTQHDHYQWMNVGWHGSKRVYHCFIHFDIKDGKIWLQQNYTDQDLAEELVKMGVPREDIVLGLHPPYKRPFTNYGVA